MSRDDSAGAVNAIHHGPKFKVPGLVGTGAAFSGADWQFANSVVSSLLKWLGYIDRAILN